MHYLFTDPSLERNRGRAIAVSVAAAAAIIGLVGWMPFPSSFSAPGTVVAAPFSEVTARTSGTLTQLQMPPTHIVEAGRPLVRLDDREWDFEWAAEQAVLAHTDAMARRALHESAADLEVIQAHRAVMLQRLARLQEHRSNLDVRAPIPGIWVSGSLEDLTGLWVERGNVLGYVIHPEQRQFLAVISQDEARWLFDEAGVRRARVRLRGSADEPLESPSWRVIPAEQRTLPSPALGWFGGGDVAIRQDTSDGTDAARTFFEVRLDLPAADAAALLHGRTGRVRFRIAPESIWTQATRRIRQLMRRER